MAEALQHFITSDQENINNANGATRQKTAASSKSTGTSKGTTGNSGGLPQWAIDGSRKFTEWHVDSSLDKMEKKLLEMMSAGFKAGDKSGALLRSASSGIRKNSKGDWELGPELDRQVKVLKDVLGVKPKPKYIHDNSKIGWNSKDLVIWLLLPFERKIKLYLNPVAVAESRPKVGLRAPEKVFRTQATACLSVCPQESVEADRVGRSSCVG